MYEFTVGAHTAANARAIVRVLEGERGPARDVVLLNAGAALFIAGKATSVEDGIQLAATAIDQQQARRTLERLIALSVSEESVAGVGA